MNASPFIEHSGCRFLNVPHMQDMVNEVLVEDCYQMDRWPSGSVVLDIGACYGEFGIVMAKRGHKVLAFEPAKENREIVMLNRQLHPEDQPLGEHTIFSDAITEVPERADFYYQPEHPGGSRISFFVAGPIRKVVETSTMKDAIAMSRGRYRQVGKVCVKMDIEGSEAGIFAGDLSWIDDIHLIALEWHARDGHVYAEILRSKGFDVELTGSGPKPRPAWEPMMNGGLIFSIRHAA